MAGGENCAPAREENTVRILKTQTTQPITNTFSNKYNIFKTLSSFAYLVVYRHGEDTNYFASKESIFLSHTSLIRDFLNTYKIHKVVCDRPP